MGSDTLIANKIHQAPLLQKCQFIKFWALLKSLSLQIFDQTMWKNLKQADAMYFLRLIEYEIVNIFTESTFGKFTNIL